MAHRVRAFDWAATPLGPIERWPRSLTSITSICLRSRFQMAIYWGPDLICIYNDAERDVLGQLHPGALGRSARELLRDSWDVLAPQLESVMESGQSTWVRDQPLRFDRRGTVEIGYFTYSYSPIPDDDGTVGGVLLVSEDTTAHVLAERRLDAVRDLASRSMDATTERDACVAAAAVLEGRADVPYTLIYLLEDEGDGAVCVAAGGTDGAPPPVDLASGADGPAAILSALARPGAPGVVADTHVFLGARADGAGRAFVAPMARGSSDPVSGFLVAGINDDLAFDAPYRSFLETVAIVLGRSVAAARERQTERERTRSIEAPDNARIALFSNASNELVASIRATVDASRLRSPDSEARGRGDERTLADDQLQRLVDDLKAAQRRIVAAGDMERRRIERNLHDGAQQRMMAARLELGLLAERLRAGETVEAAALERLRGDLDDALDELRDVAHGLYPPLLASDGLKAALTAICRRAVVPVEIDIVDVPRLPAAIESAVYFCCVEALQNVVKHAGADARAWLRLRVTRGAVELRVRDDGAGFDQRAVSGGAGLMNLRDRLEALGGHVEISSTPGQGTCVAGLVPVP